LASDPILSFHHLDRSTIIPLIIHKKDAITVHMPVKVEISYTILGGSRIAVIGCNIIGPCLMRL
jgi:hypothetical protein